MPTADIMSADIRSLGATSGTAEPIAEWTTIGLAKADGASQPVLYVEFRKDGVPVDPGPWWAVNKARRFADDDAQNFPASPRCGGRRSRDADRNPAPHRARWGTRTSGRRRYLPAVEPVRRCLRTGAGGLCGEARRQQADRVGHQRHAGRARSAFELHGFQELPRDPGADPR